MRNEEQHMGQDRQEGKERIDGEKLRREKVMEEDWSKEKSGR